jgi:hypothetical protein
MIGFGDKGAGNGFTTFLWATRHSAQIRQMSFQLCDFEHLNQLLLFSRQR